MGQLLDKRRADTNKRIDDLRRRLGAAEELCRDRACVYLTGSFGRGEASPLSDLDIFIAGMGTMEERPLSRLNEIIVAAELVKVSRDLEFPEFSRDGQFLTYHSASGLTEGLGTERDDFDNTLTARCLLLLESRPLLGIAGYDQILDEVIARYWRDYSDHSQCFAPAFLTNDILRLWRTFCLNYEAKRVVAPPEAKAKDRLKHFKLAHSRLLTCFSALLYLLEVYGTSGTVSPGDTRAMVKLSPTQRLEWLLHRRPGGAVAASLARALDLYEQFLETTARPGAELLQSFSGDTAKARATEEHRFGNAVFECVQALAAESKHKRLYRFLIV